MLFRSRRHTWSLNNGSQRSGRERKKEPKEPRERKIKIMIEEEVMEEISREGGVSLPLLSSIRGPINETERFVIYPCDPSFKVAT